MRTRSAGLRVVLPCFWLIASQAASATPFFAPDLGASFDGHTQNWTADADTPNRPIGSHPSAAVGDERSTGLIDKQTLIGAKALVQEAINGARELGTSALTAAGLDDPGTAQGTDSDYFSAGLFSPHTNHEAATPLRWSPAMSAAPDAATRLTDDSEGSADVVVQSIATAIALMTDPVVLVTALIGLLLFESAKYVQMSRRRRRERRLRRIQERLMRMGVKPALLPNDRKRRRPRGSKRQGAGRDRL